MGEVRIVKIGEVADMTWTDPRVETGREALHCVAWWELCRRKRCADCCAIVWGEGSFGQECSVWRE